MKGGGAFEAGGVGFLPCRGHPMVIWVHRDSHDLITRTRQPVSCQYDNYDHSSHMHAARDAEDLFPMPLQEIYAFDKCHCFDQEYYMIANSFVRLALGGPKPAYSVVVGIDRATVARSECLLWSNIG